MIRITLKLDENRKHHTTLSLPILERTKSRQRVKLDDGREAGLFLPRGEILREGDLVMSSDGIVVKIIASLEKVSTVTSSNTKDIVRAAYHLGNRHILVQVEDGWLRYQHDHVIDSMLRDLGMNIKLENAPFEPESGAYSKS